MSVGKEIFQPGWRGNNAYLFTWFDVENTYLTNATLNWVHLGQADISASIVTFMDLNETLPKSGFGLYAQADEKGFGVGVQVNLELLYDIDISHTGILYNISVPLTSEPLAPFGISEYPLSTIIHAWGAAWSGSPTPMNSVIDFYTATATIEDFESAWSAPSLGL